METRKYKLSCRKPGGTASKGAIAYKLCLPTKWVRAMGLTPEERAVQLSFDGKSISIRKAEEKPDG